MTGSFAHHTEGEVRERQMLCRVPLSWQEHSTLFQRQQEIWDPPGHSGSGTCFQLSWSLLPQ